MYLTGSFLIGYLEVRYSLLYHVLLLLQTDIARMWKWLVVWIMEAWSHYLFSVNGISKFDYSMQNSIAIYLIDLTLTLVVLKLTAKPTTTLILCKRF